MRQWGIPPDEPGDIFLHSKHIRLHLLGARIKLRDHFVGRSVNFLGRDQFIDHSAMSCAKFAAHANQCRGIHGAVDVDDGVVQWLRDGERTTNILYCLGDEGKGVRIFRDGNRGPDTIEGIIR